MPSETSRVHQEADAGTIPTYSTSQSFTGFSTCATRLSWNCRSDEKARYQCCIRKHQEVTALILKAPNPESVTKKSVVCFRGLKGIEPLSQALHPIYA